MSEEDNPKQTETKDSPQENKEKQPLEKSTVNGENNSGIDSKESKGNGKEKPEEKEEEKESQKKVLTEKDGNLEEQEGKKGKESKGEKIECKEDATSKVNEKKKEVPKRELPDLKREKDPIKLLKMIQEGNPGEDYVYYRTSSYEKSKCGYVGLSNQGATCYLNSLIQTMYMTPEIREQIFKWRYDKKVHKASDRSIALQLQRIFAKLQLSSKRSVSTKKLTKSFGWDRAQSFVQHDVNELQRVLLDALDKTFAPNLYQKVTELKKCKTEEEKEKVCKKFDKQIEENKEFFISDLYRGEMIDYVLAKDFKDENGEEIGRRKKDNYMDIQLVIRGIKSVEDALSQYIVPEVLKDDNQWFCDQLEKKVDAIKGLSFSKFPKILTLNLKRFDYNPITWTREKLGHKVTFPFKLDVRKFYNKPPAEDVCTEYELFSVLIHSGSARMGHYYAYIKTFEDDKWLSFNDEKVSEINQGDVERMFGKDDAGSVSTNAYMLMYRCKDLEKKRKIDYNLLPEEISKKIIEKNEKVKRAIESNKRSKEYVFLKFITDRRECIDQFFCKKILTVEQVKIIFYHRLCQKRGEEFKEEIPYNCIRLREFSYGQYKGRTYSTRTNWTLDSLDLIGTENMIVEFKEKDGDWTDDEEKICLFVVPLFPHGDKFQQYSRLYVDNRITLFGFRKFIADVYRQNKTYAKKDFVNADHVQIYLKGDRKVITYTEEDQNKELENELNWHNNGEVHVELFEEKPRGYDILYNKHFTYKLYYNTPGTNDFSNIINASRFISVEELKMILADLIKLDTKEFRIYYKGNYEKRPFEKPKMLLKNTMLYHEGKIFIEIGKPLEKYEHICPFYEFTDIEIIEKNEPETKKSFMKKSNSSDDVQREINNFGAIVLYDENKANTVEEHRFGDDTTQLSKYDAAMVIANKWKEARKKAFRMNKNKKVGTEVDEKKTESEKKIGEKETKTKVEQETHEIASKNENDIEDLADSVVKDSIIEEAVVEVSVVESPTDPVVEETQINAADNQADASKNVEKINDLKYPEDSDVEKIVDEIMRDEIEEKEKKKKETEEEKEEREAKELYEKMENEDQDTEFTPHQYHYRQRKQFEYMFKFMVSEKDKVIDVKKKAAKAINEEFKKKKKEKVVDPECLRIRSTRYYQLLHILKCNGKTIKEVVPFFGKDSKFAYQILEEKEKFGETDTLVRIREWKPDEWKFGEFVEMVIDRNDQKNIKSIICKKKKLKENEIFIYIMPKSMDLKKKNAGFLEWSETIEKDNIDNIKIYDDVGILFVRKNKLGKEKYDMKKIKKYFKMSDPTKNRSYVKEEALVIKTEFDQKKEEKKDEKDEKDEKKDKNDLEENINKYGGESRI